jgi:predicted permease
MKLLLRSLSRNPGLLATAVLLLALGIGATTALFSVVNAVLLAPLPYKEPERLVRIWTELAARGVAHFPESPGNLDELRRESRLFEDIAGINTGNATLGHAGSSEPRRIQTANGSWNFLPLLGVQPLLGRGFTAEDGAFSSSDVAAGAQFPANTFALPRVALISHALWQGEFGGSPEVIGRQVQVNDVDVEIIGVLPPGLRLHMAAVTGVAPDPELWTPLRVDLAAAPRNNVFLNVVGRLGPGVDIAQARAEIEAITSRMYDAHPVMRAAGARPWMAPYADDLVADVRGSIWALLGAACFVLLIACANVASLLLMRAAGRSREFAVRHALGAGRGRLLRQLLGEAAVLAALGAIGGVLVAWLGLHLLLQTAPDNIARLDAVAIDGRVLLFALVAAAATTLLAGLLPAWQASRATSVEALRERSSSALGGGQRLRFALVAGEVALSFVLLIGTGLMVRSFIELSRTDTGFDAERVLTFELNLPNQRYPEFAQRRDLIYALQDRLAQLPMVESVAATAPLPLAGQPFNGRYAVAPPTGDETTAYRQANYRVIVPGWFETMRTPLLAGRHLTRDDEINVTPVVVVDDVMASTAWPGADPIGKQVWLRLQQPEPQPFEVVGVVRRQLQESLHDAPRETVYFTAGSAGLFGANAWAVRGSGSLDGLLARIRTEVAALDPSLPLGQVRLMQAYVDDATARTRFALQLIGAFGAIALLIATVGLYAAIHSLVRQRRAEIGLRMSVGAGTTDIFRLFVRRGLWLAAAGIGVGLLAALALSHTLSALLVNTVPTDPATYAAITLMFVVIALAASALPALRAARVQPMAVLRDE